jgi:hypothetical protein
MEPSEMNRPERPGNGEDGRFAPPAGQAGPSYEAVESDEGRALSRRQFLSGALAGGAAGVAVAAGTGVVVYSVMEARNLQALESAQAEIARLQGLIDLYATLERTGLDAVVYAGLDALALPLSAVERGARALADGLKRIRERLLSAQGALAEAREAFAWLRNQVAALAAGLEALQGTIGRALEKAAALPLVEAVGGLFDRIVELLPFDWGERIRQAFQGVAASIAGTDELVRGINTHLIEPVQEKWFSEEEGKGLGATLLEPLAAHILEPLEAHLGELVALAETWQAKLEAPAQKVLAERTSVRDEIARYKQEHGFE